MAKSMEELNEFEKVDINNFFDDEDFQAKTERKVEILSKRQKELIDDFFEILKENDSEKLLKLESHIKNLEQLAISVENFPALFERQELAGDTRTPTSLVDSLIKHQRQGDSTLRLPSKAILGKGFVVAKTHTLAEFSKYASHIKGCEKISQDFDNEVALSTFSLLSEDVYLNLISDESQPIEYRREWALSLLLLWEHWSEATVESVAPVLQKVWTARRKLAPAFGTMMGTSELLTISMQMDDQWIQFIKEKMGDEGVSQAMEEFLFGISFEQILTLRMILRTKGIAAIGRDEVSYFLGEHVKADAGLDYRDFYSLYTIRRDNARSRQRLNMNGPQKTLEDYFIQFVTKKNKEKQKNDTFAN